MSSLSQIHSRIDFLSASPIEAVSVVTGVDLLDKTEGDVTHCVMQYCIQLI
jgi:hypothetical protein